MSLSIKDFLSDTITKCYENSIEFKLLKADNLEDCSGCFTDDPLELNSAIDREDWLEILVHETCHMDQHIEESPLWTNKRVDFNIFDGNLLKYASTRVVENAFKAYCELEIDCDKRAVEKIKKYNLDIDLSKYIRDANCYHHSYYYFHKYHIFYDDENLPYKDELIQTFNDKKILDIQYKWKEHKQLERFLVRNNKKL